MEIGKAILLITLTLELLLSVNAADPPTCVNGVVAHITNEGPERTCEVKFFLAGKTTPINCQEDNSAVTIKAGETKDVTCHSIEIPSPIVGDKIIVKWCDLEGVVGYGAGEISKSISLTVTPHEIGKETGGTLNAIAEIAPPQENVKVIAERRGCFLGVCTSWEQFGTRYTNSEGKIMVSKSFTPTDLSSLPTGGIIQLKAVNSAEGYGTSNTEKVTIVEETIPTTSSTTTSTSTVPSVVTGCKVFATREGLVGGTTSSGHIIIERDHFAALPSIKALNKKIEITYNEKSVIVSVLDVGPWNTHDDYWNPPEERETFRELSQCMPEAQAAYYNGYNNGKDGFGRTVTNPAGIDLADGTFWDDLGMTNNDWVEWRFVEEETTTSTSTTTLTTTTTSFSPSECKCSWPCWEGKCNNLGRCWWQKGFLGLFNHCYSCDGSDYQITRCGDYTREYNCLADNCQVGNDECRWNGKECVNILLVSTTTTI